MNVKHCIDTSDDNNIVSWQSVKNAGFVDGVMIQATYGLHSNDSTAMDKMLGAKSVGMPFGFYHYFYPRMDPIAQADHFYSFVLGLCGGFKGQIAPWCDCEESDGYGAEFVTQQTLAYLRAIANHIGAGNSQLYSGLSFADTYFVGDLSYYRIVVADYGSLGSDPQAPDFTKRPIPALWAAHNVVGWQYTDKHLVPGIAAAVDGTLLDFDECLVS